MPFWYIIWQMCVSPQIANSPWNVGVCQHVRPQNVGNSNTHTYSKVRTCGHSTMYIHREHGILYVVWGHLTFEYMF